MVVCAQSFAASVAQAADPDVEKYQNIILASLNKGKSEKVSLDKKLSVMASELSATKSNPGTALANKNGIYDMQFELVNIQLSDPDLLSKHDFYSSIRTSNYVGIDITKQDELYHVTIIGVKRYVDLSDVKPAITEDTVIIRGKWLDVNSKPANIVVIAPDGGDFMYLIDKLNAKNEFTVPIKTASAGKYMVEVNGKSNKGPLSAATVLLFRDTPPEYTYENADSSDNSIEYWLSLINRERSKSGLPPLTLSKRLSQIAQAHSRDMAEHDFVAHVSPTTGDVLDRIKGISYIRLGENIAMGNSVAVIHNGLMDSPAHRKNILGDYTSVGLGLYKKGDSYYATQVFIK
jgi:uncharacterized protein YkwD